MTHSPSASSLAVAGLGLVALAAAALTVGADRATAAHRSTAGCRTSVVDAVARSGPAVVTVRTTGGSRGGGWGWSVAGTGSGVIVHPAGYVVTNSHVVRGAGRIVVESSRLTSARSRSYSAVVVEDDPSHDLALLRISDAEGPLPFVELRDGDEPAVGETAVAIGNPYGIGDTVTVGVVSALDRSAAVQGGGTLRGLLQTDASINVGNSGGALLDLDGALLGVNCSVHPTARGIAFSVPARQVRALLDRNVAVARSAREAPPRAAPPIAAVIVPSSGDPLPPPSTRRAPAPPAPSSGRPTVGLMLRSDRGPVVVSSVGPASAADASGLRPGDVIVEIDGRSVDGASDAARTFSSAARGQALALGVERGGVRMRILLVVPSN